MASRTPTSQPTLDPIHARVAEIERLPMERVNVGAEASFWRGWSCTKGASIRAPKVSESSGVTVHSSCA